MSSVRARPDPGTHLRLFDSYLWLYDLHTPSGANGLVHVPLIYATHLRVQHEAYAHALARFPKLIGTASHLNGTLVDGVVYRFDLAGYAEFRSACLKGITLDPHLSGELVRKSLQLRSTLPAACLAAESDFLVTHRVSKAALRRLFDGVADAIAVNLANPFVDSAVMLAREMFGSRRLFAELYEQILGEPAFSHLAYFSTELERLQTAATHGSVTAWDIRRFCWVAGFLCHGTPDRSPFESPGYVAAKIGVLDPSHPDDDAAASVDVLAAPEMGLDSEGSPDAWTDDGNQLLRMMRLLRVLQVNEEFRHYWQARVMRLFRLLAGDDELVLESFGLRDYLNISRENSDHKGISVR